MATQKIQVTQVKRKGKTETITAAHVETEMINGRVVPAESIVNQGVVNGR